MSSGARSSRSRWPGRLRTRPTGDGRVIGRGTAGSCVGGSGGARRACIPEPPRIWEGGVVYGPLLGAGKSCTTHPLLRAGGRGRPLVGGGFDSGEGTPPPFARFS